MPMKAAQLLYVKCNSFLNCLFRVVPLAGFVGAKEKRAKWYVRTERKEKPNTEIGNPLNSAFLNWICLAREWFVVISCIVTNRTLTEPLYLCLSFRAHPVAGKFQTFDVISTEIKCGKENSAEAFDTSMLEGFAEYFERIISSKWTQAENPWKWNDKDNGKTSFRSNCGTQPFIYQYSNI